MAKYVAALADLKGGPDQPNDNEGNEGVVGVPDRREQGESSCNDECHQRDGSECGEHLGDYSGRTCTLRIIADNIM